MKRTIIAASLVAALAAPAFAQQASQLVLSLENQLAREGIDGVDLATASVDELARVKMILNDTESSVEQEARILAVFN